MTAIRIVPSDIRRRVRYVFFARRRVVVGLVALCVILAGLLGSMAAAPTVIRRVYKDNFLKSMRDERDIQRGRLQENVVQMTSVEKSLEEQRIRVEKLITIYGLERSLGTGGFSLPFHLRADPNDLHIDEALHRETALR